MDSHCSSSKTINSGVPQDSVLSPTLLLLFINYLINLIQLSIHSYADHTILHFSTSYNMRPTQQELNNSRRDAIGRLTSDLSLVSDWSRAILVLFNASKTQFLQLSTRHKLPDNYPLFFNDTQLPLSSTLNTLDLAFTENLNWQFHISTLAKSASKELCVLWRLRPFFSPLSAACSVQGPYPPMNELWLSCQGEFNSYSSFKQAFRLINSPPLTDCLEC